MPITLLSKQETIPMLDQPLENGLVKEVMKKTSAAAKARDRVIYGCRHCQSRNTRRPRVFGSSNQDTRSDRGLEDDQDAEREIDAAVSPQGILAAEDQGANTTGWDEEDRPNLKHTSDIDLEAMIEDPVPVASSSDNRATGASHNANHTHQNSPKCKLRSFNGMRSHLKEKYVLFFLLCQ
jgi:hypothetical protein